MWLISNENVKLKLAAYIKRILKRKEAVENMKCAAKNFRFRLYWRVAQILQSFWNVNMAWNGFSKMAVAIFGHFFGPNTLNGTLNGSFLYPWTTKIPVAWNIYPLFTTPIFPFKYILYWKKTTSKLFQTFFKIFYRCNN